MRSIFVIFIIAILICISAYFSRHKTVEGTNPAHGLVANSSFGQASEKQKEIWHGEYFCRGAIKLADPNDVRYDDQEYKPLIKQCASEVIAARHHTSTDKVLVSTLSSADQASAKSYAAAAETLWNKYDQGDIETLALFGVGTDNLDRESYIRAYYKYNGVTIPKPDDFSVRIFENAEIPLPAGGASNIAWLDNDNIIYPANDDAHPIRQMDAKYNEFPRNEPITTVNLKTLEKKSNYTQGEVVDLIRRLSSHWKAADGAPDLCWEAKKLAEASPEKAPVICHELSPLIYESDSGCKKLLKGDGSACANVLPPCVNHRPCDRNDWKSIIIKSDAGNEKTLHFDRPVNTGLNYDSISDTYWVTGADTVYRFDRQFNRISQETYPKGVWGHVSCSTDIPGVDWIPCVWLKYSVRPGFLVINYSEIRNKDFGKPYKPKIETEGLFLVTKDGRAFKIHDRMFHGAVRPTLFCGDGTLRGILCTGSYEGPLELVGGPEPEGQFSISPDGCKVIFIQTDGLKNEDQAGEFTTLYYGIKARVGLIDVCSYFQKETGASSH